MKTYLIAFCALALVMLAVEPAHAVNLAWTEQNRTVIVDNTVQVTKPNKKWDTQTKHYEDPAPVKWVRHVVDANPQIFLRYSTNVKGKTAHNYAALIVKNELAGRGIKVTSTQNKVINGRNIAIINGIRGDERFMIGVWRHRDIGFQMECMAKTDMFDRFMGEFQQAINSVQIIKEQGL